jgi:hypothetical protein
MTGKFAGHVLLYPTPIPHEKKLKTFHIYPLFLSSLYDFRVVVQEKFLAQMRPRK